MKTSKKQIHDSKIEFTVTIDEKEMIDSQEKSLKKMSKDLKLQGFRKGHVPADVAKKHVGEEAIKKEAEYIIVEKSYRSIIKTEKLNPISKPEVKVITPSPFTFSIIFEVYPAINLGNYKKIKVKVKDVKVTDKEIEDVVKQLQEKLVMFNEVDRKVLKTDRVTLDISATDPDGNNLKTFEASEYQLLLSKEIYPAEVEKHIVGLKKGDDKEFVAKISSDHHGKSIAGKKCSFKVKIHKVEEQKLPEVNEEFVKNITGKNESVQRLKEEISNELKNKKSLDSRGQSENEVIEKLNKEIKFDVPESIVKQEQEKMLSDIKHNASHYNIPWGDYLKQMKKTEEDLLKELLKEAQKRIKTQLLIREIIQAEKVSIEEKEVENVADFEFNRVSRQHKDVNKKDFLKDGRYYNEIFSKMLFSKLMDLFLELPKKK